MRAFLLGRENPDGSHTPGFIEQWPGYRDEVERRLPK